MDSNSILSIVAIIVSVLGSIYTIINHRKVRSRCCGSKEIVLASLDIDSTTPETKDSSIKQQKSILPPLPKSDDEETNKN